MNRIGKRGRVNEDHRIHVALQLIDPNRRRILQLTLTAPYGFADGCQWQPALHAIILLTMVPLFAQPAPAAARPQPNLARAVRDASDIVVAHIASGSIRASSAEVVLQVTWVLKGSLIPGTEVRAVLEEGAYFSAADVADLRVYPKVSGIWFLTTAGGQYTIISRASGKGYLPEAAALLPGDAPAGAADPDAVVAVGNQLISALRWLAREHSGELKPRQVEQRDGDRTVPSLILSLCASQFDRIARDLASLGDAATRDLYCELARDKSPHLRAIGIAGLIAADDPDGPKLASSALEELAASANVQPIVERLELYHNPDDPDSVRALAGLATADLPIPRLKQSVSYALRSLHTGEAMPALVALLDSTEVNVRANALTGICLFVRDSPTITPEDDRTMSSIPPGPSTPFWTAETERMCWTGTLDEAARASDYVAFWKFWWQMHEADVRKR